MRKKTSPPARTAPTTSCDQPSKGLIAKAEKPTRSAGAEPVLDNRSHRTLQDEPDEPTAGRCNPGIFTTGIVRG